MKAELVDTVERREDDGGRGYVGRTTATASAMARESEGEVQGANGGVGAVERATWRSTSASSGVGGKQVAPWRARAHRRHLSACSGERKQLTGAGQHSAGPASGLPGKIPFSFLFSVFCYLF